MKQKTVDCTGCTQTGNSWCRVDGTESRPVVKCRTGTLCRVHFTCMLCWDPCLPAPPQAMCGGGNPLLPQACGSGRPPELGAQTRLSSEILTPTAFGAGGGHIRWVERGWWVNSSEDARHSSVLYICNYLVGRTYRPGGCKELSSILADQQRPRIWAQAPNSGGGGKLRGLSQ